jgi:hypothetical protein
MIGYVADEEFQRTAWFGKSRYVSSPEEIYNQVFSDLDLEQFIISPEVALGDLQRAAATQLLRKMQYFDEIMGENLSPEGVIDHPLWLEIREAAREVLDALECRAIS